MFGFKAPMVLATVFVLYFYSVSVQASGCGESERTGSDSIVLKAGYVNVNFYADRCDNNSIQFKNFVDNATVKCWAEVAVNSIEIDDGKEEWLTTYTDSYNYGCDAWSSRPAILTSKKLQGYDLIYRYVRGKPWYAFDNLISKPLSCEFEDENSNIVLNQIVMPGDHSSYRHFADSFYGSCAAMYIKKSDDDYDVLLRRSSVGNEYSIQNTADYAQLCFSIDSSDRYIVKEMVTASSFGAFHSAKNIEQSRCISEKMRTIASHDGHDILIKRIGTVPKVSLKNTSAKKVTCRIYNDQGKVFVDNDIKPGQHTLWVNYDDYLKNQHSCL